MMARFLLFITITSGFLDLITTEVLFVVEKEQILLNCLSEKDVVWQRRTVGEMDDEEIYINEIVVTKFKERFNISSNNLIIKEVVFGDAGSYKCVGENGLGSIIKQYDLNVIGSASCVVSNVDEVIGLNSCRVKPSIVEYMCTIGHNGTSKPQITWTDMSTGNAANHRSANFSNGIEISSHLFVSADMHLPRFRCSAEELATCTTEEVAVKYAIESDSHEEIQDDSDDRTVVCFANSSLACSYAWTMGSIIVSSTHILPLKKLRASGATGGTTVRVACEATCQLTKPCILRVMSVKVYIPSHPKDDDSTNIIIGGVAAFLIAGVLLLTFIAVIKRTSLMEKLMCCHKRPIEITETSEMLPINGICSVTSSAIVVDETLLPLYLIFRMQSFGDRAAFIDPISGRTFRFDELGRLIENVARGLYFDHGVLTEQRVALVAPNCIEYPVVFHAVLRIGAVCVPVAHSSSPDDLRSCLTDSRVSMVITTSECLEKCRRVKEFTSFKILLIKGEPNNGQNTLERYFSPDDRPDHHGELPDVPKPLSADAAISYSSGTTGASKGCIHTHGSYLANLKQMIHPSVEMFRQGSEVSVAAVTMSHMYGQDLYFLAGMASGCTMVVMETFSVRQYLYLTAKYKVTCAHLVPTNLSMILESDLVSEFDLSNLYKVETKAASLPPRVASLLKEKLPNCRLLKGYGMTEAMCISKEVMTDEEESESVGWLNPGVNVLEVMTDEEESKSVGRLLPGVKVVIYGVKSDEVLGPCQPGKICVDSPALFKGYFDRSNQAAYNSKFFKTNDLGYVDERGRLHVTGRVDDLMKCGVYLVSPNEIEDIIWTHRKVKDVGVAETPSPRWGQAPMAFVVKAVDDLTADEIHTFVAGQVAPHKKLQEVRFVASVPRLPNGKIKRTELRKMALRRECI